jgi:2-polyprenyl-3-methyl-5-hydroxy-6-metoxy-1,4-benzoquinol methylase
MSDKYSDKPAEYFANANLLLASKIYGENLRILDVGCGQGALIRILQERCCLELAYGVELVPEAAEIARRFARMVWSESIESFDPPIEPLSLDYVICADVLEHLRDPDTVLAKLRRLLKRDGRLLVSLPNASNRRLVWDLVIKNDWRYAPSGIMDETHLRWFTSTSARRTLGNAGFSVSHFEYVFWGRGGTLVHRLSNGLLSRFVASQLLFIANPTSSSKIGT